MTVVRARGLQNFVVADSLLLLKKIVCNRRD
jgi:hypothetical protein